MQCLVIKRFVPFEIIKWTLLSDIGFIKIANGEIWVFNRSYTQYIPLSLYDLQSWMGSPSIFVYDCSNAGIIVSCFENFAEQHEREYLEQVKLSDYSKDAQLQLSLGPWWQSIDC